MAHQLLFDFVADARTVLELPDPVVEFGSLQVEPDQPGDLRSLFEGRDFTGTDMRPGSGVDRVEDLRGLSLGDGSVGTALCLDTLEHCEDPLQACRELHRVTAPDGVCIISSVMLLGIHAYPSDYWRFTPEGLRVLLAPFDERWAVGFGDPSAPFFVFGVGSKQRKLDLSLDSFPKLAAAQQRYERAEGKVRLGPTRLSLRELGGTLTRELPRALRQRASARLRGRG